MVGVSVWPDIEAGDVGPDPVLAAFVGVEQLLALTHWDKILYPLTSAELFKCEGLMRR